MSLRDQFLNLLGRFTGIAGAAMTLSNDYQSEEGQLARDAAIVALISQIVGTLAPLATFITDVRQYIADNGAAPGPAGPPAAALEAAVPVLEGLHHDLEAAVPALEVAAASVAEEIRLTIHGDA